MINKIIDPSINVTIAIIELLFECTTRKKGCTVEQILEHVHKTKIYVLSAIKFIIDNDIVEFEKDALYLKEKYITNIKSGNAIEGIIKEVITANKYFIEYTYFLSKGKTKDEGVELVKAIYGLNQNSDKIIRIFDRWISFLNIDIRATVDKNITINRLENIDNKLNAMKFIKDEFDIYFKELSNDVTQDLSDAIINLDVDVKESVNDAGRALEDFLRIDLASHIDLSKCSGIVQICNYLNKYPEFPTKLNNISTSLGNIRSMGKAHGTDAKLKQRWKIKKITALSYLLLIFAVIKSYLEYKINGKLIF